MSIPPAPVARRRQRPSTTERHTCFVSRIASPRAETVMTTSGSTPTGTVPPAGGAPPPLPSGLSEFVWNTHEYLNEYIRFADSKAAAVFAIGAAFLGVLWTANDQHLKCASPRAWTL